MGFATVIAILSTAGFYSILNMNQGSQAMRQISQAYLPEMQLSSAFEREILNARIYFIYHVTIQKPGALDAGWKRYRNARELMPKLQAQVKSSAMLEGLRQPTEQLASDLDSYEVLLKEILLAVEKKENHGDGFNKLIADWARMGGKLVDSAGDLDRQCLGVVAGEAADHGTSLSRAADLNLVGFVLAGLAGVLIAWVLTRSLGRKLRSDIQMLQRASEEILGASQETATASAALAEGAARQASSIEAASASCEEVNSMARKTAEHARSMASEMASSQLASESGSAVLQQMVSAMSEMSASNDKVSKIIRVIDEIAFQTNILALNAAVEAARAGEAGMGFAVVADEVRNLAQRSAQAARDTTEMIGQSVTTAERGFSYVEKVVETMEAIAGHASRAKSMADELSSASAEQTKGIAQIAQEIQALEAVTQRMAASAQQSASVAAELSGRTDRMQEIAGDLTSVAGV